MVGCGGSVSEFFETVFVSPTTKVVEALDGQIRFDIADDTFSEAVTFVLSNVLSLPSIPALLIASAIDFELDGQSPSNDLKLNLKYDPATLESGVSEADLRLYRVEGATATLVEGSTVDATANLVTGEVRAEGTYVVAAPAE